MTLHSDDIKFMRIFAGVPWKGGVNRAALSASKRLLRVGKLFFQRPVAPSLSSAKHRGESPVC